MNGDLPGNNDFNNQPQTPSDFDQRINGNISTKKPSMKKKGLVILLIIVLIAGLGAGAYFMFFNKPNASQNNTAGTNKSSTNNTVASSLKPAEVTLAVQDYVKTQYTQVMPEDTKLTGEQISFKSSEIAPYWKISGVKFYVNYIADGASNLSISVSSLGDITALTKMYKGVGDAVIKSLTSQGFVESKDNIYGTKDSILLAYIKDDAICTVSTPDTSMVSSVVTLSCGQLSKYTKNLSSYKEIEPYTTAYAKTQTINEGVVFSLEEMQFSRLGYSNATVSLSGVSGGLGGFAGLFYKTPTSDWIYFKGTQQVLPCTDYNTTDLQAAFVLTPCYDSSKTGNATDTTVGNYFI